MPSGLLASVSMDSAHAPSILASGMFFSCSELHSVSGLAVGLLTTCTVGDAVVIMLLASSTAAEAVVEVSFEVLVDEVVREEDNMEDDDEAGLPRPVTGGVDCFLFTESL